MADPSPFAAAVRAHDWPRYIATQFARQDKRADLFTLYAFDAEIDRITRIASDPLPGEIRLQWWREALHGERADEGAKWGQKGRISVKSCEILFDRRK